MSEEEALEMKLRSEMQIQFRESESEKRSMSR